MPDERLKKKRAPVSEFLLSRMLNPGSQSSAFSPDLTKLRQQTAFLSDRLMHTYVEYLFLRPIIADKSLTARMANENKLTGFNLLGETLYWAFIQGLVKIWDDRDKQDRHVSIRKILRQASDHRMVRELERINSRWTIPHGESLEPELVEKLRQEEERENLEDFRRRFDALLKRGNEILCSPELTAFKKARDKLIAHTETRQADGELERFDIQALHLKFGDERTLLTSTLEVVHELQCLIQGLDNSWSSLRELYVEDVCAFWEIEGLDERCP